jgi:hypothetical protein
LRHHAGQGLLDLSNRTLGIELALLLETALTLHEFLAVEVRQGVEDRIAEVLRVR